MRRTLALATLLGLLALLMLGCAGAGRGDPDAAGRWPDGRRGHLLLIGGGLSDENRAVYERLIELTRASARARRESPPRIVIATAASLDEASAERSKRRTLAAYCPECAIVAIGRETDPAAGEAAIRAADAMFFTGGDQKRITTRYLSAIESAPGVRPVDTPEAAAMRDLLTRGGVIAGTSAGEAMMSDPMFLTGRSAEALGFRSTRARPGPDDDADERRAQVPLGPQIGPGMGFLPRVIADSHFFERHRFGRLVAALEASRVRLGIGVSEDACVEVDLTTGEATGLSEAASLLVDVGGLVREGDVRRGIRTRVIGRGERISLARVLSRPPTTVVAPRRDAPEEIADDAEARRQPGGSAGRFFARAQTPGSPPVVLRLDGYAQAGRPDAEGWAVVEIRPIGAAPD